MNSGVRRQRDRIAAEKRIAEIEAGDRYSCAEKYALGTGPLDDGSHVQPDLPADSESGTFWPSEAPLPTWSDEDEIEAKEILERPPLAGTTVGPDFVPQPEKFGPGMIETYTGDTYYFDNPDPTHIHLADIAHALSNHCRYAGHTSRFYSVGEHSLLVRNILKAQGYDDFIQLVGLFHDAHEAYVMDAPRPLKPLLGKAFVQVADKADVAIAVWFGNQGISMYPGFFHASNIKRADNMALVHERKQLMTAPPERWETGFEDVPELPEEIKNYYQDSLPHLGWSSPTIIENRFIEAAHELGVSE